MEDHLHVLHPRRSGIVDEAPARDSGVVCLVRLQLRVAPVDQAIGCEIGIERKAEQAALPAPIDRRQTGHRSFDESAVGIQDPQAARQLFRHQHLAAGQERDGPRALQPRYHRRLIERDVRLMFRRTVLTGDRRLLMGRLLRARVKVRGLRGDAGNQEKRAENRLFHRG